MAGDIFFVQPRNPLDGIGVAQTEAEGEQGVVVGIANVQRGVQGVARPGKGQRAATVVVYLPLGGAEQYIGHAAALGAR